MGARDNRLRVRTRIFEQPPVGHARSSDSGTVRHNEATLFRGRDQLPPPKVCDTRRPRSRGADGIHVNLLLGSQEGGRRVATDSESETFEQVYTSEAFPHGDAEDDTGFNRHTRVGSKPRSEGRLFTRTDQVRAPQVPTLHVRQRPIRICGAPLRTVHFTPGVHPDREGDRGGAPEAGCHDFHVPRRLAGCGPISRGDGSGAQANLAAHVRPRVHYKHREIPPNPLSGSHLPGCVSRPSEGAGPPLGGPRVESSTMCGSLPSGSNGPGKSLAQAAWPDGQHGGSDNLLQAEDETNPTSPALVLSTSSAPDKPSSAHYALVSPPPSVVASRGQPYPGMRLPTTSANGDHRHRCATLRLGGGGDLAPASGGGPVGFRTSLGPYKHSGNASGVQCTPAFSVRHPGESGPGAMRQRYGGSVHQSPRGHSVGSPLCAGVGSHPLVYTPWGYAVSSPPPRRGERNCRCSLQGLDHPYGVVAAPASGSVALPPDRPAARGLVCLPGEQPTPDLLRKETRPRRVADRRAGVSVGRSAGLCLSTFLPHPSSVGQDRAGELQSPPHSPVLAPPAVVSQANQSSGSPPGDPSTEGRYLIPTQLRHASSGSGGSAPDLLGAVSRSLRSAGLSRRAATLAAHSRRASTRKVYGSRLHHFFRWCRQRSLHPPTTSVGEVGDFLLYLFDSGLKTATVKNYRSAISAIHEGFSDGSSVPDNRAIGQLVKGMFVTRPPTRQLVPSWDLFRVLSTLSQPPFEPIGNATLLQLSIKVVFLLAVATSRRRSELHSLSVAMGHIRWEPGGVRLVPVLGFLTKNQSESFMPPDIFVPDIKSFSAVADDKLWCPVRALKWYISRTASLRAGHKQLFITTTSPFRPASRDTIARWIVTAIRSVPGGWPAANGPIRAHDVRGVSSSWAFFKGVPLGDITQAACWKNPNTFSECYLKDVLQAEGRAGREVLKAASRSSDLRQASSQQGPR